jgi:hypothetical protein
MERVYHGLRVAPLELGALLRRHDVLIRLQDENPPRPGGEVAWLKPEALHEVDLEPVDAAQVLLAQARYEPVLVLTPERLVFRRHTPPAGERPSERALPEPPLPRERHELQQRQEYPGRQQQPPRRHRGVRENEGLHPLRMAAHEALRHEPPIGRPEHVCGPHAFGIQDASQPVKELDRGGDERVARCDDPVVLIESRDAREAGFSDHRPAWQDKERFLALSAGDVVPVHPGDGGVPERVCGPERSKLLPPLDCDAPSRKIFALHRGIFPSLLALTALSPIRASRSRP